MRTNKIFDTDRKVRAVHATVDECLINELLKDDLSSDEKRDIANKLKDKLINDAAWEQQNDEWWYKYGKIKGETKGMWIGTGLCLSGYLIGCFLNTILKK